jgi:hypothetical protein
MSATVFVLGPFEPLLIQSFIELNITEESEDLETNITNNLPIIYVNAEKSKSKYELFIQKYNSINRYKNKIPKLSFKTLTSPILEKYIFNIINIMNKIPIIGILLSILVMILSGILYSIYIATLYIFLLNLHVIADTINFIQRLLLIIIYHIICLLSYIVIYPLILVSIIPGLVIYYYIDKNVIESILCSTFVLSIFLTIAYKLEKNSIYRTNDLMIDQIIDRRPSNNNINYYETFVRARIVRE